MHDSSEDDYEEDDYEEDDYEEDNYEEDDYEEDEFSKNTLESEFSGNIESDYQCTTSWDEDSSYSGYDE